VALAEDFRSALRTLPEDWREARIALRFREPETAAQAAGYLGALNAGRHGDIVRFSTSRSGLGARPDAVVRALRRLDRARLHGELEVVAAETAEDAPAPTTLQAQSPNGSVAAEWDAQLATLPPDWSDIYGEVDLRSTADLERTALLLSPLNTSRFGERPGFRFRCARNFGYGAAPELVRRCLQRLDEVAIRAEVRILHALSDTRPMGTQGPVWYVGGKPV
jgi:hypothetical protein